MSAAAIVDATIGAVQDYNAKAAAVVCRNGANTVGMSAEAGATATADSRDATDYSNVADKLATYFVEYGTASNS